MEIHVYEIVRGQSAYDINDYSISIHSSELALKLLRNFGDLISHINFCARKLSQAVISSNINEYCSESLQELRVHDSDGNIALDWKKPFQNLSKVHFDGGKFSFENLNGMLPSMSHLYVSSMYFSSSIVCHFPNLKHIQFGVHSIYDKFFESNPQLQSIHVIGMNNFDVLRVADEKLNNLEAIELSSFNFLLFHNPNNENAVVHLKNVKRFHITLGERVRAFIPLKFDQLEEIEYDSVYEPITKEWIEFVGKQQKLKILIINALLNLQCFQQLKLLIEKTPELEVIKINLSWIANINEIAPIMVAKSKLKKVILYNIAEERCNKLKEITDYQWQFEGKVNVPETKYIHATFIHRENFF